MLFSHKLLRRFLGVLWLIDGLLQLQPRMFTPEMVNSVLWPTIAGQPAPIAASLQPAITVISQHLTLANVLIAILECEIGLFLLAGLWIRGTVIISMIWSLLVWYGGEGLGLLFTGQASVLTGAPGAVLLYPLLGLLVYPRKSASPRADVEARGAMLLSRVQFRWLLVGFWAFAALLQLQPYWWEPGQLSHVLSDMIGQGGANRFLVDPVLHVSAVAVASVEIPLNAVLLELFIGLAIALAIVKQEHLRPWLALSLALCAVIWWIPQGLGMLFTGMTTDCNTGPLLILMTLACWPKVSRRQSAQASSLQTANVPEVSARGSESALA